MPPRPHGACPAWAGARRTGSAPLTRAQARRQGLDVASLVQEPAQSGRGCPRRRKALIQLTSTAPGRKQGCSATTREEARPQHRRRRTRASSPTTKARGRELDTSPPICRLKSRAAGPFPPARRSRPSSSPTLARLLMSGPPSSPSTRARSPSKAGEPRDLRRKPSGTRKKTPKSAPKYRTERRTSPDRRASVKPRSATARSFVAHGNKGLSSTPVKRSTSARPGFSQPKQRESQATRAWRSKSARGERTKQAEQAYRPECAAEVRLLNPKEAPRRPDGPPG